MINSRQVHICFFAVVLAMSLIVIMSPTVSCRPNSNEVENMAEALRYLEQIDKYYSQMARPR